MHMYVYMYIYNYACVYIYIYIYICLCIYLNMYMYVVKRNSCVHQGGLNKYAYFLPNSALAEVGRKHMALDQTKTCMLQPCMVCYHYSQLAGLQLQCSTFPPHWSCVCHLSQAMSISCHLPHSCQF